jgi:hypothetical protein
MKIYANAFDPQYAPLHNLGMQHDVPKLLRSMMVAAGVKQTGLAKRLGKKVSQPDISRWLKGAAPEVQNYERIVALAYDLGVLSDVSSEDVAASMLEPARLRTVKLKGYVGAGAQAHFYALTDDAYEEVPAPPNATDRTVAVEIKGSSMGKALNSWLVFYDDVRSPVSDDQINELCVVGLADDRILIKRIERKSNGRAGFRLVSNNPEEPVIEDPVIEWAALVTSMQRRR